MMNRQRQGIMDIYKDVQLFEEEIENGTRANEEKDAMEKPAAEEICLAAPSIYYYSINGVLHEL